MKAILRTKIQDWTNQKAGLPEIKKGTLISVDRSRDRMHGYGSDYIGTVKIKNSVYHFDLTKKEFEIVN